MAKNSLPQSSKPRKDIDSMNLQEIQAHNIELLTELKRLLSERAERETVTKPVLVNAAKLPTKRMTKRLATFDTMTDDEQVDSIKEKWVQ